MVSPFGNLLGKTRKSSVQDILRSSNKAICAANEREVTVRSDRVAGVKQRLKNAGFMIIGTSEPLGNSKKIWFINRNPINLLG